MPSNPVANHIKSKQAEKLVQTLSSGVRVIVHGVSNFEMQELAMSIPEPKPPRLKDPDTGREYENFDDPDYAKAKSASDIRRGLMSLDSMLIGVELVDGLPEDESWMNAVRFKAKRGLIDISGYDMENPIEKEFVFKKYVAFLGTSDWEILQGKIKESEEAAAKADAMFPSDEEQPTDSGAQPQA